MYWYSAGHDADPRQTVNRSEFQAFLVGIQAILSNPREFTFEFIADSTYVKYGMAAGQHAKRTSNGDLWAAIWEIWLNISHKCLAIQWVPSHAEQQDVDEGKLTLNQLMHNHIADKLAGEFAARVAVPGHFADQLARARSRA